MSCWRLMSPVLLGDQKEAETSGKFGLGECGTRSRNPGEVKAVGSRKLTGVDLRKPDRCILRDKSKC